jgi:hypothetical protein
MAGRRARYLAGHSLGFVWKAEQAWWAGRAPFKELQLFSAQSPVRMVNPLQTLNAMKSGYCAMNANWFQ